MLPLISDPRIIFHSSVRCAAFFVLFVEAKWSTCVHHVPIVPANARFTILCSIGRGSRIAEWEKIWTKIPSTAAPWNRFSSNFISTRSVNFFFAEGIFTPIFGCRSHPEYSKIPFPSSLTKQRCWSSYGTDRPKPARTRNSTIWSIVVYFLAWWRKPLQRYIEKERSNRVFKFRTTVPVAGRAESDTRWKVVLPAARSRFRV